MEAVHSPEMSSPKKIVILQGVQAHKTQYFYNATEPLQVVYRVAQKNVYTLYSSITLEQIKMKFLFQGDRVIESKIQGHLSYQFFFCINTVVTVLE